MTVDEPEAPSLLVRPLSPLRRAHGEACLLGRERGPGPAHPSVRTPARGILRGNRRLRYPLLALTTSQDMGPARHAIEQRVIAGFAATPPAGASLVPTVHAPKKG